MSVFVVTGAVPRTYANLAVEGVRLIETEGSVTSVIARPTVMVRQARIRA